MQDLVHVPVRGRHRLVRRLAVLARVVVSGTVTTSSFMSTVPVSGLSVAVSLVIWTSVGEWVSALACRSGRAGAPVGIPGHYPGRARRRGLPALSARLGCWQAVVRLQGNRGMPVPGLWPVP